MVCSSCGRPCEFLDCYCAGCGAAVAATKTEIASLARRGLAAILDFILLWSVIMLIVILLPEQTLKDGLAQKGPAAVIPIALCLLGLFYYIHLEMAFGATLGKAIVGIQVLGIGKEACSLRASLIRNVLRVVDAFGAYLIGIVVAALSPSRQRIGDRFAGTIVVRRSSTTTMRVLMTSLWLVLASSGFVAFHLIPHH